MINLNINLTGYRLDIVAEILNKKGMFIKALYLIEFNFKIELIEPTKSPNLNPYY